MGSLADDILKFMQAANSLTELPLVRAIDLAVVATLETEVSKNRTAAEVCKKMRLQMTALQRNKGFENLPAQRSLFSAFAEGRMYLELREKVHINRVAESNVQGQKTPDFEIKSDSKSIRAELKALGMAGADQNYERVREAALDSKMDIERQVGQGRPFASSVYVIQPANDGKDGYNPFSKRKVIELLIDKVGGLYKSGQFPTGEMTVLFVDLDQWALGQSPLDSLIPAYSEEYRSNCVSGVLWNVAFGQIGNQVYMSAEFEGATNIDGVLSKQGVLLEFPNVGGLIFRNSGGGYYGLFRAKDMDECVEHLGAVLTGYNDDQNTRGYALCGGEGPLPKRRAVGRLRRLLHGVVPSCCRHDHREGRMPSRTPGR